MQTTHWKQGYLFIPSYRQSLNRKDKHLINHLQQMQNKFPDLYFIATKLSIPFISQSW